MDNRFTWVPLYKELAEALLRYKDDRRPLVDWIYRELGKITRSDGRSLVDYLQQRDRSRIIDIDPFSVFGIFNRSVTWSNRTELLKMFKNHFGLSSEVPTDFDGIPTLYAGNSFFFSWNDDNDRRIKDQWALFEKVVKNEDCEKEYNQVLDDGMAKYSLTMTLFWIAPDRFLALDSRNRNYLELYGYSLDYPDLRYKDYISILERVKNDMNSGKLKLQSFIDLSYDAWIKSTETPGVWMWSGDENTFTQNILKVGSSGKGIDYPSFNSKDELGKAYRAHAGNEDVKIPYMYWDMIHNMKIGDIVVVYSSHKERKQPLYHKLYGWGRITSDCYFKMDEDNPIQRNVEWYYPQPTEPVIENRTKNTLYLHRVDGLDANNIITLLGINNNGITGEQTNNNMANTYYDEITTALRDKKNIILQGAPGTGKTYAIPEIVTRLCNEKVDYSNRSEVMEAYTKLVDQKRVVFTTFHQSMDYEDFIEGLKPVVDDEKGSINYIVEDGIFKQICNEASKPIIINNSIDINSNATIWKVSLKGTYDNDVRTDCLNNGHIRIGWDEYGEDYNEQSSFKTGGRIILDAFYEKMEEGDIIFSCYTQKQIDAIGIVEGEVEWHDEYPVYKRLRKVRWLVKGIREDITNITGKKMTLGTVYRLNDVSIDDVLAILKKYSAAGQTTSEKNTAPYVVVIDEINRGNVSKIFGELITLLEADKRSDGAMPLKVKLPYSKTVFSIPSNLYLIGTMNTADRSLTQFDYAMRRRFRFITMAYNCVPLELPAGKTFQQPLFDKVSGLFIKNLDQYKNNPNVKIEPADCFSQEFNPMDLWIGPSYFITDNNDKSGLYNNITYEIIPTLMHYIDDGVFVDETPVYQVIDELKAEF